MFKLKTIKYGTFEKRAVVYYVQGHDQGHDHYQGHDHDLDHDLDHDIDHDKQHLLDWHLRGKTFFGKSTFLYDKTS